MKYKIISVFLICFLIILLNLFVCLGCKYNEENETILEVPIILNSLGIPDVARSIFFNKGYIFIASRNENFFIIEADDFNNLKLVGKCQIPKYSCDVSIYEDYAFIASGKSGLQIIDISNKEKPTIISSIETIESALRLRVVDNYVFIADREAGLVIVDVTDKKNPTICSSYKTPSWAYDVFIKDQYAFLAVRESGIFIIDVTDKKNPTKVSSLNTPGHSCSIFVEDNYAYVTDRHAGLQVIDISNIKEPKIIGNYREKDKDYYDIFVSKDYVYVTYEKYNANFEIIKSGLKIFDLTTKENPVPVRDLDTSSEAGSIFIDNELVYLIHGESELLVLMAIDNETNYKIEKYVENFYLEILNKKPEGEEINNYKKLLISGELSVIDFAKSFIFSEDFINRNVSNEEFINILYKALLNRESDKGGFNNWLKKLEDGEKREDIFKYFIDSEEFKNLCNEYNIDLGFY
ncbi:MAG: DUF4214 domain-containing protein [Actinobacteria bacterium]|nr:DUF4214 domain-containing protein [Chloroflexota bacterium]MBE3128733.1 DUF4214 domain-containing protein [Actinomycetota bacterium]